MSTPEVRPGDEMDYIIIIPRESHPTGIFDYRGTIVRRSDLLKKVTG